MKRRNKNIIVCAPTGIAALNIEGATLHRTFGVPTRIIAQDEECDNIKKQKVIDKADIILIDEISMCRIDLFRFVVNSILASEERTGRKKQVVVIGDFFQLSPVLTRNEARNFQKIYGKKLYAFESVYWKKLNFQCIILTQIVRQSDPAFAGVLNDIRDGIPNFAAFVHTTEDDSEAVSICARNDEVKEINDCQLQKLSDIRKYDADVWGDCPDTPAEKQLALAVGARVIMLNNDSKNRWVNGSLGTITSLAQKEITIKIDGGGECGVERCTWETKEYYLHRYGDRYEVQTDVVASFSQYPVKLAYAITIHKSQGQTYEKVNIHPDGIFAEGQLYVALSRCKSLAGIRIVGNLTEKQLIVPKKVAEFFNTLLTTSSLSGGQQRVKAQTLKVVVNKPLDVPESGGQEKVVVNKVLKRCFATTKGEVTRKRIVALCQQDSFITSTQIANELGINRSAVQKHLGKLIASYELKRTGSKKSGRWWVRSTTD